MIRLNFRGQAVAVPGDVVADGLAQSLPGWLTGKDKPTGQQTLIRTGATALIPMLLSMIHRDIVARGAPIPPPDLRCADAKRDIVTYAARYLIGTIAQLANQELYVVQGSDADGVYVVSGLIPARADVVSETATPDAAPDADAATRAPTS